MKRGRWLFNHLIISITIDILYSYSFQTNEHFSPFNIRILSKSFFFKYRSTDVITYRFPGYSNDLMISSRERNRQIHLLIIVK